ncbi:MAG TPA: hypothetical protein VHA76_03385 [Solirubrobacterales bacterium]|nr:hypothetical protein [Solirubrobacterales bacterium]
MSDLGARATRLLAAFAACDLETVEAMCAARVLVYGTDRGERWEDRRSLLAALEPMRALGLSAAWVEPPTIGPAWVAGVALYKGAEMDPTEVRVTMAFEEDRLAHGHFSVEVD